MAERLEWLMQCREEDLQFRKLQSERKRLSDVRKEVDEYCNMVKNLSTISTLVAGFASMMFFEIDVPVATNYYVWAVYGGCVAVIVGSMLMSMIITSYVLVAVMKYDCHQSAISFKTYWEQLCESEWKRAFNIFTTGATLFLVNLGLLGWVVLVNYRVASFTGSSIAGSCILFLVLRTYKKWASVLRNSSKPFLQRPEDFVNVELNMDMPLTPRFDFVQSKTV